MAKDIGCFRKRLLALQCALSETLAEMGDAVSPKPSPSPAKRKNQTKNRFNRFEEMYASGRWTKPKELRKKQQSCYGNKMNFARITPAQIYPVTCLFFSNVALNHSSLIAYFHTVSFILFLIYYKRIFKNKSLFLTYLLFLTNFD